MMLMPRKNFNLFDDFFDDPFFNRNDNMIMKTDIKENEDSFNLTIDLPGYDKENIKMHINNGYLNINAKSEINNDESDDEGKFVRRERHYGECSRSFYVGEDIKDEDIKATYRNGTLNVIIPKVKEIKKDEVKYIEIGE